MKKLPQGKTPWDDLSEKELGIVFEEYSKALKFLYIVTNRFVDVCKEERSYWTRGIGGEAMEIARQAIVGTHNTDPSLHSVQMVWLALHDLYYVTKAQHRFYGAFWFSDKEIRFQELVTTPKKAFTDAEKIMKQMFRQYEEENLSRVMSDARRTLFNLDVYRLYH